MFKCVFLNSYSRMDDKTFIIIGLNMKNRLLNIEYSFIFILIT